MASPKRPNCSGAPEVEVGARLRRSSVKAPLKKLLLTTALAAAALNVQMRAAELVVFTRDTWDRYSCHAWEVCNPYGPRSYHIGNPRHRDALTVAREIDPNVTFAYWVGEHASRE
jgi:hypothetical protein